MIQALQTRPVAIPATLQHTPKRPSLSQTSAMPSRAEFLGNRHALAPGLRAPRAGRAALSCQALNLSPVLQALPAIGGATAGAVVGVPAAITAAVIISGLSKLVDGTLNKNDKLSVPGFAATVGVEAVVLMAHMTLGAVVSCAVVGRPLL